MEPKSIPKRSKIEVDFQERKNTLQDRLGSVSDHLDTILGPVLGHFFDFGTGFTMVSCTSAFLKKRGLKMYFGAILTDLGAQENPKEKPKGTQEAPKTKPK